MKIVECADRHPRRQWNHILETMDRETGRGVFVKTEGSMVLGRKLPPLAKPQAKV